MKLRINFTLKTGLTGEIPVLAILNYGYKEFDVNKEKNVYKPLKYYTGIKVTKSDWDEVLKLPIKKSLQAQLLQIEKQINDVYHALSVNGDAGTWRSGRTERGRRRSWARRRRRPGRLSRRSWDGRRWWSSGVRMRAGWRLTARSFSPRARRGAHM
ncbi:MAG: hypothetical protein HYZ43_09975, partial [Flavobacteriia bacterium]|nr:hypothetical protein [Flavobacteriia bacterium]